MPTESFTRTWTHAHDPETAAKLAASPVQGSVYTARLAHSAAVAGWTVDVRTSGNHTLRVVMTKPTSSGSEYVSVEWYRGKLSSITHQLRDASGAVLPGGNSNPSSVTQLRTKMGL